MAGIVVCGGGVIGLSTGILLARAGHEVTLVERDAEGPPDDALGAWDHWSRPGVAQFRQPHNLFPGYCEVLRDEMPDVLAGLYDAGGVPQDFVANMPPMIEDRSPRPGDDRFQFVTGRRPMVEQVHARIAEAEAGLTVRRGVSVDGVLADVTDGRPPLIRGVTTSEGPIESDLVIDAMGRRSPTHRWLEELGFRPPVRRSQESSFTYYTRYFSGSERPVQMGPAVSAIGSFMVLTLYGDNSTWSVTLWAPGGDRPLKRFRDPQVYEAVLRECPLHAHWLDGDPITDMMPAAGILDRYHRFVVDDEPVSPGLLPVGDAWACTNPSAGRGLSVGLKHARRLRDVIGDSSGDPVELSREWDAVTENEFSSWYWDQLDADERRRRGLDDVREGRADHVADASPLPERYSKAMRALLNDADVYRAVMETLGCLAPADEVFTRPGIWDKVEEAAGDPFIIPGPDRARLMELVS